VTISPNGRDRHEAGPNKNLKNNPMHSSRG
jgi:hypothetical protein